MKNEVKFSTGMWTNISQIQNQRIICKHAFWEVMVEFWMNYCMSVVCNMMMSMHELKQLLKVVLKDKRDWVRIKRGFWSTALKSEYRLRLNTTTKSFTQFLMIVNVKCVIIC